MCTKYIRQHVKRERENEIYIYTHMCMCIYTQIYLYIYIYIFTSSYMYILQAILQVSLDACGFGLPPGASPGSVLARAWTPGASKAS